MITTGKAYDLMGLNTNLASGDAFGRLRVSQPFTIFDTKLLYTKGVSYWDEVIGGGGTSTHEPSVSCVDMGVSSNNDYVIRQTRQRINYQPGKSHLVYMTGIIDIDSGITSRIGPFQSNAVAPYDSQFDGLCFESIKGTVYVSNYRNGTLLQRIAQSDWDDPMNGLGESRITIDWKKCQIFVIDYEWLGVGRVRFGLNVDGVTYYVACFKNANNVTNAYMRSPNQPLRYEIRSSGGTGAMKQICASIQSEGGWNPEGAQAAVGTGNSTISIGSAWELLIAIRLKDSQLDANVIVENLSTIAVSSGDYEYGLFWNPTIGGSLTWTDYPIGAIQTALGDGSTNDITPGDIIMWSGYNSSDTDAQSTNIDTSLRLGSGIDGTRDVIALGCRTFSGSDTFAGTMIVKQLT